jgi:hypothetical protein
VGGGGSAGSNAASCTTTPTAASSADVSARDFMAAGLCRLSGSMGGWATFAGRFSSFAGGVASPEGLLFDSVAT